MKIRLLLAVLSLIFSALVSFEDSFANQGNLLAHQNLELDSNQAIIHK